jgi:hypothetical protein
VNPYPLEDPPALPGRQQKPAWASRLGTPLAGCAQNFCLKPQIHRKIEQISINRQNRMSEGCISPLIRNQCFRQIEGFATEMAAYFDYP